MRQHWHELLETALASELLWDEGVEAARNACVAGAPLAAAAITAAAWYDNPLTGGRALLRALACFSVLPLRLPAWLTALRPGPQPESGEPAFVAGFGYVSEAAARHVRDSAAALASALPGPRLRFWLEHRHAIRARAGALNAAGLCALVFADAGLEADAAERLYLLLRLGPALAEAQRAKRAGLAAFPFFADGYAYEGGWPEAPASEPCSEDRLEQLKRAVGIDV